MASTTWLDTNRRAAEERYRALPQPTAKDEAFRFTPLADLEERDLSLLREAAPPELNLRDPGEAALLSLAGADVALDGEAAGATFTDLRSASAREALPFGDHFAGDKFAQLAAARWENGAYLRVPAGVKVEAPLRVAFVAAGPENHARHVIVLEENAEATLVTESWSGEGARTVSELTEVNLGRGARLHWVQLQRYGAGTKAMVRQHLTLDKGAELKVTPLHLGAGKIQVRQEASFAGEGANLEVEGAAVGSGQQHFDFWLDVDHAAPKTISQVHFWFVMGDSSRAVFNGMIQIRPNASDVEAAQRAKSLLLGPKSTVHAIPKLIIQTDAVKCAHGASVSSVNPEQVHYLQSRGISRTDAERMIVRGFTGPVLVRLPTEELRARAEAALDRKQGGLSQ